MTIAGAGTASHSTVTSPGTPIRPGSSESSTQIWCEAVLRLPHASTASHSRVKMYVPAQGPSAEDSDKTTSTEPSQPSAAVTSAGGGTAMRYRAELQIGGRIASVGQRLLDTASKLMTRQGLEALGKEIK